MEEYFVFTYKESSMRHEKYLGIDGEGHIKFRGDSISLFMQDMRTHHIMLKQISFEPPQDLITKVAEMYAPPGKVKPVTSLKDTKEEKK